MKIFLTIFLVTLGVIAAWRKAEGLDSMAKQLETALRDHVSSVEPSARIPGPSTSPNGQYVLHLKTDPPHEVGLVAMKQEYKLKDAPYFWINLKMDNFPKEPSQVILLPTDTGMRRDEIPSDWITSDYMRSRKPTRPLSYFALNPRRTLTKLDEAGTKWMAASGWVEKHPISPRMLARTYWTVDPKAQRLTAVMFMIHHVQDQAEAQRIMAALEKMLDQ